MVPLFLAENIYFWVNQESILLLKHTAVCVLYYARKQMPGEQL